MKAHILNTTPCTVPNSIYFSTLPMKKKKEKKGNLCLIPKVAFGLYSAREVRAVNTDFFFLSNYNNNLYIFAAESKIFTRLAPEPVCLLLLGDTFYVVAYIVAPWKYLRA